MLTCSNLLSGAVAVIMAIYDEYDMALLMIIVAALFDFLDGFSARLLRVCSPIGKELDSLADCISFGLAPSAMLFSYLSIDLDWWALPALLMAAFSALRLANFNLDERQTTSFLGLATPANALFWASLIAALYTLDMAMPLWADIILLLSSFFSCYLLMSEMPFFSLKFHDYSFANNRLRYVFLIVDLLIIVTAVIVSALTSVKLLPALELAITSIILWYILLNVLIACKHNNEETSKE